MDTANIFGKVLLKGLVLTGVIILMCSPPAAAKMWTVNDALPNALSDSLDISVQIRHRYEHRNNFDFNDRRDDRDGFHLIRTRINTDWKPAKHFRVFVQLQDSRLTESEFSIQTGFEDDIDIRQGYLEFKDLFGGHIDFRAGRQELSYGSQRLVGGFNWSNVAQSFDALKLTYKKSKSSLEVFGARKVIIKSDKPNEWNEEDDFYGVYAACGEPENHRLSAYYLFRKTDVPVNFGTGAGSGVLDESTVGFRLEGFELNGFDYTLQYARQFGDFGTQNIKADALIAILGYTFETNWTPRIALQWDKASGDKNPYDNERNTFDNLFPTNHLYYGYMDRASLQNIDSKHLRLSVKPSKKLYLQGDIHLIGLDETTDSMYHAGRGELRWSSNSNVDDDAGTEYDFLAKYSLNERIKFLGGVSTFKTGGYLEQTGSADDGEFFYFQTTVTF